MDDRNPGASALRYENFREMVSADISVDSFPPLSFMDLKQQDREKRPMKPMAKALLAATCALSLSIGLSPRAMAHVSGDAVKIGVLNDQSGLYADFGGRGSVVAAQMAAEDFGGKVLGKPIQIISADHQNKPD